LETNSIDPTDFSKFRDKEIALKLKEKIHRLAEKIPREKIKIMHVCGTHEHTITYFGIRKLLPKNIELIAGPGCPVCVVPASEVDKAVKLALEGITVYTFGDMFKVPGSKLSLAKASARGGKVKIVYSFLDAIKHFKDNNVKESVFLGVGFETTAPSFASPLAEKKVPKGMSIQPVFRITVPITKYALKVHKHDLQGIIAPGHVSTITGASAWSFIAENHGVPVVVAGFEPLDVLLAIYMILKSIEERSPKIFNEYGRVVTWEGNLRAKEYINEVMETVEGAWRGIGVIPDSAWVLNDKYRDYDARFNYDLKVEVDRELNPSCRCAEVVLGLAKPTDCKLFGKPCKPETPLGPCMVSSEGTCSIWYKYGGYKIEELSGEKS
jgi:hydrogenase expression/formation protein HypD